VFGSGQDGSWGQKRIVGQLLAAGIHHNTWFTSDVYYVSIVARIAALIEGLEPAGRQLHLSSHFGCSKFPLTHFAASDFSRESEAFHSTGRLISFSAGRRRWASASRSLLQRHRHLLLITLINGWKMRQLLQMDNALIDLMDSSLNQRRPCTRVAVVSFGEFCRS